VNLHAAAGVRGRHSHGSGAMAQRVVDQVAQRLFEAEGIGRHGECDGCDHVDVSPRGMGATREALGDPVKKLLPLDLLAFHR
jgi:hypothetical protein